MKTLYVINPEKREIENKLMILVFTVTLYFYFINLIFVFGQTQMLFFIMCTLIRQIRGEVRHKQAELQSNVDYVRVECRSRSRSSF